MLDLLSWINFYHKRKTGRVSNLHTVFHVEEFVKPSSPVSFLAPIFKFQRIFQQRNSRTFTGGKVLKIILDASPRIDWLSRKGCEQGSIWVIAVHNLIYIAFIHSLDPFFGYFVIQLPYIFEPVLMYLYPLYLFLLPCIPCAPFKPFYNFEV